MKNEKLLRAISTIILAGILAACSVVDVDYSSLEEAIAEAESENDAATASANGNNVPLGKYWVTQTEKAGFELAIKSARAALSFNSQTEVDKETDDLLAAIATFKNARRTGKADPINITALSAKIIEAGFEKIFVVEASSQEEVADGRKWVTKQVMSIFETAINDAAAKGLTSSVQPVVNTYTDILNTGIITFKGEQNSGTKQTGFTQDGFNVLITFAKTLINGVKKSYNNGNDVSPVEYWVRQSSFDTFNNAINTAQNTDENIDSAYLSLVDAINIFKNAASLGVMPNKNSLFDAIRAADTVKDGVVSAANAAQALYGSKWANQMQWEPFNTAYKNALDAAIDANAAKNNVDTLTIELLTATDIFDSAVNKNGPGTMQNVKSITISGLSSFNGRQITLYLLESSNIPNEKPKIYESGTIKNGVIGEITLSSGGTPWRGNGLFYVFIKIQTDPQQYYISKSKVDFSISAPKAVTSFSNYKKYAFRYIFGEIADIPSGVITLDDWCIDIAGMDYNEMLESGYLPGQFYKNEALTTQVFLGSDKINAYTVIYCAFPLQPLDWLP